MDNIIEFKPQIAPLLPTKTTRGVLVGQYLVVSYASIDLNSPVYTIYNTQGKRILDTKWTDIDEAIKLANWLDDLYKDFFPIWEEYPDADIFSLAKWSIKNGVKIYDAIRKGEIK